MSYRRLTAKDLEIVKDAFLFGTSGPRLARALRVSKETVRRRFCDLRLQGLTRGKLVRHSPHSTVVQWGEPYEGRLVVGTRIGSAPALNRPGWIGKALPDAVSRLDGQTWVIEARS